MHWEHREDRPHPHPPPTHDPVVLDEGVQRAAEGKTVAHTAHTLAVRAEYVSVVVGAVVAQSSANLHVLQHLGRRGGRQVEEKQDG